MNELIEKSKQVIRLAADMSLTYYDKPLVIAYSGGKDSDVLLHLAEGCLHPQEYEVTHSHTTVDAPETVYHIRDTFDRLTNQGVKCEVLYSRDKEGKMVTMWNLIPKKKTPPTRIARYCCQILKEVGLPHRLVAVGVRRGESIKRQGRDIFGIQTSTLKKAKFFSLEHTQEVYSEALARDPIWDCTLIKTMRDHGNTVVNPIYEWSDQNIWDYIKAKQISINPLYERGYTRIGCIGCPLATYYQRLKEFSDYPTYKQAYINAFDKMLIERKKEGKTTNPLWETGEDVFDWWIEKYRYNVKGQMSLEDFISGGDE